MDGAGTPGAVPRSSCILCARPTLWLTLDGTPFCATHAGLLRGERALVPVEAAEASPEWR